MAKPTKKPTTRKKSVAKGGLKPSFTFNPKQLVIVAAAVVGLGGIIFAAFAATTTQWEVESWSQSSSANFKTVADATASNGQYVQFVAQTSTATPTPTPPTTGLPSGVSLQPIDGGPNYFAKWKNSFPTDPSFFPITVFNAFDLGGNNKAAKHKEVGINTYTNLYNGITADSPPSVDVAKSLGMYVVGGPDSEYMNSTFNTKYGNTVSGWVYQDEGEKRNICEWVSNLIKPNCSSYYNAPNDATLVRYQSFIDMSNTIRKADPTRPVYQGWTNGYVFDWYLPEPASMLTQSSDIIGYDVYPLTDRRVNYGGQFSIGKVWGMHETVSLTRARANYTQPVWPVLEISQVDEGFNTSKYRPTGAQVQAEVWQSVIAGARGITYFNNCFCDLSGNSTQDVLNDSRFTDIRAAVKDVNARLTKYATVVNAPFANGFVTTTGKVNVMTKYYNGAFYIFAAARDTTTQSITFTPKSGSSVEVLDEGRSIPYNGATFSDTFAGETAVHIYKVNP